LSCGRRSGVKETFCYARGNSCSFWGSRCHPWADGCPASSRRATIARSLEQHLAGLVVEAAIDQRRTSAASPSCVPWGEIWKPQASLPVSGFNATMPHVQGLSPGRAVPFSTGVGLPVPTKIRFRSGSQVPVFHIGLSA
jgi:hypothetical protein